MSVTVWRFLLVGGGEHRQLVTPRVSEEKPADPPAGSTEWENLAFFQNRENK